MKLLARLLERWADDALRSLVARLETEAADREAELDSLKRQLAVTMAENETLAAVVARDRERIKAEGAAYARSRAEAEGVTNGNRTEQSLRGY